MVRISKKDRLKHCPKRPKPPAEKTGTRKDNLPKGYREHVSAVESTLRYIPKV